MTWRRVKPNFARYVQLGVFLVAIGFGLDYTAMPDPPAVPPPPEAITQTWLPLWWWGVTIAAAGVAGLFVEWRILGDDHPFLMTETRWRWGWVSNIAHAALCSLFAALSLSALYDVVAQGVESGHWYGWRSCVLFAGFSALNWAFLPRAKGTNL